MVSEPIWISEARKHIGLKEIPGEKHAPMILKWWRLIKRAGIRSDEVPWCAAFVGGCLETVGLRSSRFESAKSYLEWGTPLLRPAYGCVVIFLRQGGGHVGFVVGQDERGRIMVLGGNQKDKVGIDPFDRSRVVGYRWPDGHALASIDLPLIASSAPSSRNEA